MYSESDLQDAVAAGALTPASAQALRDHVARLRASSVDEEHFRLLTGFNDIFVAIASVILTASLILLFAINTLQSRFGRRLGGH